MNKPHLSLVAATLAALLAACSDAGLADPTKAAAAAPSFDQVSMQLDEADATPAAAPGGAQPAALTTAVGDHPCHPHLFVRTHELVSRWNRHVWKPLRHVRELIAKSPKLTAGATVTWEDVKDGLDRKFTMTESADGAAWTFELDIALASSSSTAAKVLWGSVATTKSASSTTTDADLTFDFTALHSVVPAEKATGQLAAQVVLVKDASKPAPGVSKKLTVALTNFLPEEGDPAGPRSGSETHLAEPGVGGYLSFHDSLVLGCPANPASKLADVTTFSRWFKSTDGAIHGRADSKATGGQIAAGNSWIGASCYSGVKGEGTNDNREGSSFWLMKLEDAAGKTLAGQDTSAVSNGGAPCDAAFGPVPTLADNSKDFDFTKLPSPAFPGQW